MSKTPNVIATITDCAVDLIEKVSSPASRAGSTVERAGRMLEEGVAPEVIALQMTLNSPNDKQYTVDKVLAYGDLYEDSKTKVTLTATQTRALIKDQRASEDNADAVASLPA